MKLLFSQRVALVVVAFYLVACGKPAGWSSGIINTNGGASHANYYRDFSGFSLQTALNLRLPLTDSSGISAPPLPLDAVFTVVATFGGTVNKISSTTVQWSAKLDAGFVAAGMCADADGNIYCASTDGTVYSFDGAGKRRWKTPVIKTGEATAFFDAILTNNGLLVTSYGGEVANISKSGLILWQRSFSSGVAGEPCADENGRMFLPVADAGCKSDTLMCLGNAGKTFWSKDLSSMVLTAAPVFEAKSVLVGGKRTVNNRETPVLVRLDASGTKHWEITLGAVPRFISTTPDGGVSVVCWNAGVGEPLSLVCRLDPDGKLKNILFYRFQVLSPVFHTGENSVFTGVQGSAYGVYLLDTSGNLSMVFSMVDAPELNLNPSVTSDGSLLFGAKKSPTLTRVGLKISLLPF